MSKRKRKNPLDFVGYENNGIKILEVYVVGCGAYGATVLCSCGRTFKTTFSAAKSIDRCKHIFRYWKGNQNDKDKQGICD